MQNRMAYASMMSALEAAPDILDRLMRGVTDTTILDRRPDPERWTLREIIPHIYDWEVIFRERIERIRNEDVPPIESVDIDMLAVEHDYAHADPDEYRMLFRREREKLITLVQTLQPEEWARYGVHQASGPRTILDQVIIAIGHVDYHFQQIVHWLDD